jgi:hypothetical protein
MRALILSLALCACGDNNQPAQTQPDTPATPDGPGPTVLAPCLDRPTDVALPPNGQLTCDLLPPGFVAR